MDELRILQCLVGIVRFYLRLHGKNQFAFSVLAANEVNRLVMRDLIHPRLKRRRRSQSDQPPKDGEPDILQDIQSPVSGSTDAPNEVQEPPFVELNEPSKRVRVSALCANHTNLGLQMLKFMRALHRPIIQSHSPVASRQMPSYL